MNSITISQSNRYIWIIRDHTFMSPSFSVFSRCPLGNYSHSECTLPSPLLHPALPYPTHKTVFPNAALKYRRGKFIMERYSINQRILMLKIFYQNQSLVTVTIRKSIYLQKWWCRLATTVARFNSPRLLFMGISKERVC